MSAFAAAVFEVRRCPFSHRNRRGFAPRPPRIIWVRISFQILFLDWFLGPTELGLSIFCDWWLLPSDSIFCRPLSILSCWLPLRHLRSVRQSLTPGASKTLVHVLISNRLDQFHRMYVGVAFRQAAVSPEGRCWPHQWSHRARSNYTSAARTSLATRIRFKTGVLAYNWCDSSVYLAEYGVTM